MKRMVISGISLAVIGLPVLYLSDIASAGSVSVVHTVTATVNQVCSISSSDASVSDTVANGATKTFEAVNTIAFSCNKTGGWNVKAVGSGTGSPVTAMVGSVSGTSIATVSGTFPTSGATSAWGMKLSGSGVSTSYSSSYVAIPATATTVASSSSVIAGGSITTNYQVYVGTTQTAGTYTGKVTYTLAAAS